MKNKIYNIQLDADQMQAVMESLDCALSLCYKGAKARFNRMFDAKHNISVQKDAQDKNND